MAIIKRTITEDETFKVPADVTSIDVELYGAQGGNSVNSLGGRGGKVTGTLVVTPEEDLDINIGRQPTDTTGGANGGGDGSGVGEAPETIEVPFGVATKTSFLSSSITISRPAGVETGDLLVALLFKGDPEGKGPNVNWQTPTGWTKATQQIGNDAKLSSCIMYKAAGPSEPSSYTFSTTQTSILSLAYGVVMRLTGANAAHGPDDIAMQINTGDIIVPEITTTLDGAVSLALYGYYSTSTPTIDYPTPNIRNIAEFNSPLLADTHYYGFRVDAYEVPTADDVGPFTGDSNISVEAVGIHIAFLPIPGSSGAGGGASDIRQGGTALANRVAVAAGGGGAGLDVNRPGGDGGGLVGLKPASSIGGGSGGTQSAGGAAGDLGGGATAGALGVGGDGAGSYGGGGGGGYYGGGGGDSYGGGGGSSYIGGLQSGTTQSGINTGHGYAVLTYDDPAFDPEPPVVTVEAAEDANGPHALVTVQAQHSEDNFTGPGSYTIERKFHDEDEFKVIAEGDYTNLATAEQYKDYIITPRRVATYRAKTTVEYEDA